MLICIFPFLSCKKNDQYFNGEIRIVKYPDKTDTIIGKELAFDGIYTGRPIVYDSIIFFISTKFHRDLMAVFSLNSLIQIDSFFTKGSGPNEFTSLDSYEQMEMVNSNLSLWLEDSDRNMLKLFRLSQSLKEKITIFDTSKVELKWQKEYKWSYLYAFIVDSNSYIVKTQAEEKFARSIDYIPGSYHLYDRKSNKKIKTFTLFKNPIINKFSEKYPLFPHEVYYSSKDMIKPDLSKIAMAMVSLGQINILDLKTGELKGFRLPKTPNFKYLINDPKVYFEYFRNISVDDDNIYVSYAGVLRDPTRPNINQVLIFNWEGELLNRIILNNSFRYMSVDPIKKYIYTIDDHDVVYRYDLTGVLKM